MPIPFLLVLTGGAVAYLLTAVLFLLTRRMPRTNSGAGWWAISSLAAGSGYAALAVLGARGLPAHGEAVYNILFVLWSSSLAIGGSHFLGRPLPARAVLALAGAVSLWLAFFSFVRPSFLPGAVAAALFCGTQNLLLAARFARGGRRHPRHLGIAAALAVSGLHWLDYPLLRPVPWFAPVGFLLCAVVAVVINTLLAALVLVQFRRRMVRAEEAALRAATRDALTGLGNRLSLDARFEQAAAHALRNGRELAVIFIDLDGFKAVNDRFGHEAGDLVLMHVARRLRAAHRDSDVVARLGGDEFVVIATDLDPRARAALLARADRVVAALRAPTVVEGRTCVVGASLGIAFFPEHGATLDHLLATADQAMYEAKRRGKGAWAVAGAALREAALP